MTTIITSCISRSMKSKIIIFFFAVLSHYFLFFVTTSIIFCASAQPTQSAPSTTTPILPIASANQQASSKSIPIVIINLDRDIERWERVQEEIEFQNLTQQTSRFSAIYGKTLSKADLQYNTTWIARHFCTKGMIGCFLSHRHVWQQVASFENDNDCMIILEDDAVLCDNFYDKIQEIITKELENQSLSNDVSNNNNNNNNNDSWDVILLGSLGCVHPNKKYGWNRIAGIMGGGQRKPKQVTEHLYIPKRAMGMHGYLLSKRGAKKLLSQAYIASGHVDVIAWGLRNLQIYSCHNPMLVHQAMVSPSTIGAVIGNKSWIPKNIILDKYTGITLEWAFNAPVLEFFGLYTLTMGRSIVYIVGGYILAILFRHQFPYLLPIHSIIFIILFILTKLTTIPAALEQKII